MTGLAAFVAARLDEDERIARAAIDKRANGDPEQWQWECTHDDTPLDPGLAIASNAEFLEHADCYARVGLRSTVNYPGLSDRGYPHLVIDGEEVRPEDARHLSRHDPARVLREVAAKRKILAAYKALAIDFTHVTENAYEFARREALEMACEALAAVWPDHPDYDRGWAP